MATESFDLRLVVPFVVVAEQLHFGHAAALLGVAQPALSQQIARLERQLGTRLLDRDGRRVTLTPAGARFLRESREIVARANLVAGALRRGRGELRIHVGEAVNPLFPRIVNSFVAAHPAITVAVTEGTGTGSMLAVEAAEADAGFDVPEGVPPGLRYAVLDRAPFGVLSSTEHRLARTGSAAWADLTGEPVFFAPPGIADGWNRALGTALTRAEVQCLEVVGPPVAKGVYLLPLIAAGRGVLVLAPWVFDPVPAGFAWTPLHPLQEVESGLVWDDRSPSEALTRFVAWARSMSLVDAAVPRPAGPGVAG